MDTRDIIMVTLGLASAAAAAWIATQPTATTPLQTSAPQAPPERIDAATQAPLAPAVAVGPLRVRVALEHGAMRQGESSALAMVEVAAVEGAEERAPASVAFVLDTSGSMDGNKLSNAKDALRGLVNALEEGDQLSLVTFDSDARVVWERQRISGDRRRLFELIDRIPAGGGTCVSCGLEAGYAVLRAAAPRFHRRLLLLSDGEANNGELNPAALQRVASGAYEVDRVVTSTIGLGRAIDGALLTTVADGGAGGYYFVRNSAVIHEILAQEGGAFGRAVARQVTLDVSPRFGARGRAALRVGDLRLGERRRFLIPFEVAPGATGEVFSARVSLETGEGRRGVTQAASVRRVASEAEVAASRDWSVSAERAREEGAAAITSALASLRYGQQEVARRTLRDSRHLLAQTLEQLRGLKHDDQGAVRAQLAEVDGLLGSLPEYTPGSDHLRAALLTHEATAHERSRGVGGEDAFYHLLIHADTELE